MRDAGIGRVLVAALHQGIADELPDRLEFYENWLNAQGLRNGTIGLAPLAAVLGFLRTEGDAYDAVTRRAGEYAAEWVVEELPPGYRRLIAASPAFLRRTLAMRVARSLVQRAYTGSRATARVRKNRGEVDIRSSIFCSVRGRSERPLCIFYAAAVARVFRLLEVEAAAAVTSCQAEGDRVCHVDVQLGPGPERLTPDAAAEGALQ
jgi:bacteriochlorophyll 4-vinyl reductase